MKLLGHRSYRMTLRYAAVTQETIGKEYADALNQIEKRYAETIIPAQRSISADPVKMLSDIIRWLKSRASHDETIKRDATILIKRISRLQLALQALTIEW